MSRFTWGGIVVALMLMSAAPATAQPRELPVAPGSWSPPAAASVVFPEAAGAYTRMAVTEYGKADWGVAYKRRSPDSALLSSIDVFFYVADGGCAKEFSGAVTALRERHAGARETERGAAPSPRGGNRRGQLAMFDYVAPFGTAPQPVRSTVYVYCHPGSRWTIKARSTAIGDVDLKAETAGVLAAIGWPAAIAR